jgi:hypothetical protein
MRRQIIAQRAEAHRQHIIRERARLIELQYTVNILRNKSRDKSHHWFKGSIKTPSTHSHHTLISPHHLRNSTTSPITNHHHRHAANSSNHPHLRRNLATLTPRARSLVICNSHHGLPITEPHPRQNTMETWTTAKSLCAMKPP